VSQHSTALARDQSGIGYPHSDRALRAHLEPLRGKEQATFPEASCLDHFSAKKAMWLFIRHFKDLDEKTLYVKSEKLKSRKTCKHDGKSQPKKGMASR